MAIPVQLRLEVGVRILATLVGTTHLYSSCSCVRRTKDLSDTAGCNACATALSVFPTIKAGVSRTGNDTQAIRSVALGRIPHRTTYSATIIRVKNATLDMRALCCQEFCKALSPVCTSHRPHLSFETLSVSRKLSIQNKVSAFLDSGKANTEPFSAIKSRTVSMVGCG